MALSHLNLCLSIQNTLNFSKFSKFGFVLRAGKKCEISFRSVRLINIPFLLEPLHPAVHQQLPGVCTGST